MVLKRQYLAPIYDWHNLRVQRPSSSYVKDRCTSLGKPVSVDTLQLLISCHKIFNTAYVTARRSLKFSAYRDYCWH